MQQSGQDPRDRVRQLEQELERARQEALKPVRKFVTFAEALAGLREGARFKRQGWDGCLAAQVPDAGSKMTAPYVYYDDGRVRVPYVVSNDDLFATDWLMAEPADQGFTIKRRADGTWDVEASEPWFVPRFREKNGRDPGAAEVVQFLGQVRSHCEEQARQNPAIRDFRVLY